VQRTSLLSAVVLLVAACGDLKEADSSGDGSEKASSSTSSSGGSERTPSDSTETGESSSGAISSGSTSSSSGGPTGAGPYGALPSGYCCTSDDECRGQRCADTGGGKKMCLDQCRFDETCVNGDITFTCDSPDKYTDGRCKPPPGFTCVPQIQFVRGTKKAGSCCTPTGDGNAGLECEGGLCNAIGDNPFVCSNACRTGADCGGGFMCFAIGERKECIPANSPYTCN
jgi:hypothetical protein